MEMVKKEFENYIRENLELFISLDFNSNNISFSESRIKYMIKKYVNSLVILKRNDEVLEEVIQYLNDHSYESYKKLDDAASKLRGIIDIYDEDNEAFETYDRKADYSIEINLEDYYDNFYFKVSLFEEYIKLVKYHTKISKGVSEHEYQLCQDYFYENVMNSVPFYTFIALLMILQFYPQKKNDVKEYIENVILTYDYPNERYVK